MRDVEVGIKVGVQVWANGDRRIVFETPLFAFNQKSLKVLDAPFANSHHIKHGLGADQECANENAVEHCSGHTDCIQKRVD